MSESNIEWADSVGNFKLRSAAIVRDGDRVLLCAVEGMNGWFLPGGKVQFGEDSKEALMRELHEELRLEATISEPVLVTESIREERGAPYQEVCFYYAVTWPESTPSETVHSGALDPHAFRWVRVCDLAAVDFVPPEIITVVMDDSDTLRHLAFDRRRVEYGNAGRSGDV